MDPYVDDNLLTSENLTHKRRKIQDCWW